MRRFSKFLQLMLQTQLLVLSIFKYIDRVLTDVSQLLAFKLCKGNFMNQFVIKSNRDSSCLKTKDFKQFSPFRNAFLTPEDTIQ